MKIVWIENLIYVHVHTHTLGEFNKIARCKIDPKKQTDFSLVSLLF